MHFGKMNTLIGDIEILDYLEDVIDVLTTSMLLNGLFDKWLVFFEPFSPTDKLNDISFTMHCRRRTRMLLIFLIHHIEVAKEEEKLLLITMRLTIIIMLNVLRM